MKLSIGIVGMPNVGKSTLFKILTKNEVNIANYPFCTIDQNVGVVTVPDERLTKLAEMSKSKKIIPAVVEFYDIAGLVKGASTGEGLGNQFLTHIRETNAVLMVLRVFQSGEIIHVENSVDPIRDMDIINTELALKDLESIDKIYKKTEGETKTGGAAQKQAIQDFGAIKLVKAGLEAGENLSSPKYVEVLENEKVRALNLLTSKKQLYLLNGKPEDVSEELKKKITERLGRSSLGEGGGAGFIIADLSAVTEIPELVKKAYEILGLMSFFTTGEDETRAWTIRQGSKAPQAAGAIHTDFEKKFIRAEVINAQKLLEAGSWSAAKQKGWLRLEGKDYVFQDGDVTEIRHG